MYDFADARKSTAAQAQPQTSFERGGVTLLEKLASVEQSVDGLPTRTP
jgi:hypothetical protein